MGERKLGILTSGGDAPGMNAAIRAAVRRGRENGFEVRGILEGYRGLLTGNIIELHSADVSEIMGRGGTILYASRCREMYEDEGIKKAAATCRENGITDLIVIGGEGSLKGAHRLAKEGIRVICVPGTIDMDIGCTDYTIGFDTAVNTAMDAIDKVRDTSASHEHVNIIEVMGRKSGYLALYCGMACGAEDILLPETYDYNEQRIIDNIVLTRKKGKTHHIIVNAEGIGHSEAMAKRIENATGIGTRATILGYMQRGGRPSCRDRSEATVMGALAVDALLDGKTDRIIVSKNGAYSDEDVEKVINTVKPLPEYAAEIAHSLSYHYAVHDLRHLQPLMER